MKQRLNLTSSSLTCLGLSKVEGVMKTLSQMDYIFVPVSRPLCCRKRNEFCPVVPRQLLTQGWSVTKKLAFGQWLTNENERVYIWCIWRKCSSLSTIRFSTHDRQTANVSEESCRRTERQCSVPPSSIRPKPVAREWHQGVVRRDFEIIKTWAYGKQKINTDAIDENLLIASIGKTRLAWQRHPFLELPKTQVKDTEEKEEVKRKIQRSQMDKPAASRKPSKVSSESWWLHFQTKRDKDSSMRLYQSWDTQENFEDCQCARKAWVDSWWLYRPYSWETSWREPGRNQRLAEKRDRWLECMTNKRNKLLTMESIFMIVLVAFNVWTIYFTTSCSLEVAGTIRKKRKSHPSTLALVAKKSLFKVSQLRKKEETVQKQTESEPVWEWRDIRGSTKEHGKDSWWTLGWCVYKCPHRRCRMWSIQRWGRCLM